jgi:hypothetical protein
MITSNYDRELGIFKSPGFFRSWLNSQELAGVSGTGSNRRLKANENPGMTEPPSGMSPSAAIRSDFGAN